ncbi:MAG: hypothetical protein AB7U30_10555 [Sulfuricellaceae bacterium]|jgi:hypothetical protein
MNTISLTQDQWQTISRAVDGALEDYYNEIRKYANDESGAYCEMMDEFEKLAGVQALLNHALQQQAA